MTVSSAYIDLFIRGKCPVGRNCPNTLQNSLQAVESFSLNKFYSKNSSKAATTSHVGTRTSERRCLIGLDKATSKSDTCMYQSRRSSIDWILLLALTHGK